MRDNNLRTLVSAVMLCAACLSTLAQEDTCSQSITLDNLVVSGNRNSSALRTGMGGSMVWKMRMMGDMPKILGNADPMHYTQMLPGIQTNGEYRGGVNIQGSENSHNDITIGGVPIYNVNHLLGFFSTFNASHYPTLRIERNARRSNRIGGELAMDFPRDTPDTLDGEFSAGLISSQGTLRMPLGRQTALTLSLRGSYMNLLYSKWLNADGMQIRYSFFDGNATLSHRIDNRNTLVADFYIGSDNGSFNEERYIADMKAVWGNCMGALHWLYDDGTWTASNTLYVTSYHNRSSLSMQSMDFALPSGITDIGYKGTLTRGRLTGSLDFTVHDIRPQRMEADGSYNKSSGISGDTRSCEAALYAEYSMPLWKHTDMTLGMRGSVYGIAGEGGFFSADPSVSLGYERDGFLAYAGYSLRHQYLLMTGFSDMGLPTEFWLSCSDRRRPQYAHILTTGISYYLPGHGYRLSVDAFYKRLYNQTDYNGTVLDFVNTEYNIDDLLLHGDGENYGFSLMLNKISGKLAGWISYTYTHARRTFPQLRASGSFPASHERPHEINSVITYSLGKHWSFGATLVCASGTPFTAPVCLSLINGNIITQFGEYNACRLSPYGRLDVSVNYKWKARSGRENGINLSLYNATSRSNELFYYISTHEDGSFSYQPVSFVLRILPSISYFCKF